MSSLQRITRSDHVASLTLPPGRVARVMGHLRQADVLLRIGICLLAAVGMWLITCGWTPPFGYRVGHLPNRDICARMAFSVPDPEGTEKLRKKTRSELTCTYTHDDRPLKELRSALKSRVFQVLAAEILGESGSAGVGRVSAGRGGPAAGRPTSAKRRSWRFTRRSRKTPT